MFRNLYADTRNILFSRGLRIALIVITVTQLFYLIAIGLIEKVLVNMQLVAEDVAFSFTTIAAFLVTASTLLITEREFSDGCIRNKLISGVKRSDAFLSAVAGGMLQGVLYAAAACVLSTVTSLLFTAGFESFTVTEIVDYWIMIAVSCVAIGGFSTALIMIFGGNKVSYIIGLALAFVLRVWDTFILDKLFPESGVCTLTGTKLEVYKFVDRFVPYSFMNMEPHYDLWSYFAGGAGLLLISVVIGLIVFERKELH